MIKRIDHVGIVVKDLDRAIVRYREVLGLSAGPVEMYGDDLLRLAFIPTRPQDSDGPTLELLEPLREGSNAWEFLQRKGPGIEHVAFLVEELDRQLEGLRRRGVPLRDRCGRIGAGGMRIAFLDPDAVDGMLTELVEPLGGDR